MAAHSVLFGLSALAAGLYGMFLTGMYPSRVRPGAMRGWAGTGLIAIGAVLAGAVVATALHGAWLHLSWPYAVIAGGLGLLLAPVAYQALPRAVHDTPAGAALLCALAGAVLGAWRAWG